MVYTVSQVFLTEASLFFLFGCWRGSMIQVQRLLVAVICLVSISGFSAEQFMVTYQDEKDFNQAHSSWVLSPNLNANRIFQIDSMTPQGRQTGLENVQVVESLSQVGSMIVKANNANDLSGLAKNHNVIIEKEKIYKAPRPVSGYKQTSSWDFELSYSVYRELEPLKGKKKPRRPAPVAPPRESIFSDVVGPKTPWGILNVKAVEAWSDSNQGKTARVLVLDTGLDVLHPAFKDSVEATKDFVGDLESEDLVTDGGGHGTHVAGTIAANISADGFTGVAPEADLLIGRVCAEDGCSSFSVVRGINWGIEKKVDVINMSLGSDFGTFAEKSAVERAEKAGVVVVAASGNDGKASVGFPAAYPTVIAVGATDIENKKADFSQWGPELDIVAPGVEVVSSVPMQTGCEPQVKLITANSEALPATCFSGSAFVSEALQAELVSAGLGKPEDFKDLDLTNKFALIERGEITFVDKVKHAIAANAAGVVIFNNTTGLMAGSLTEDGSTLAIPVVMIEQKVGQKVRQDLIAGKSISMAVKTQSTDFAAFSGTSMASPHVAGVVALMKAANKNMTPDQVRTALRLSAVKIGDKETNMKNWYGAGAVNAENAVTKAVELR